MALNLNKDTVYRTAKPKDKEYFINDGGGLNLVVGKNGTKIWKFIFTFDGKRKKLSFGVYPDTTLEAARRKAEDARQSIANRVDPSEARKEIQAARRATKLNDERISAGLPIIDSFADITRQWLLSTAHLTSETTHTKKPVESNAWRFQSWATFR
ncbi:Arm DNA-binding domain-containing protein [Methylomonas sp. CM2]|uniref:Arm DNA-binding domain-containing protein n=1 Tax=Methylomonas sp. CM2 TaxID=3417647 RepID=UPI003CF7D96E